MMESNRFLIWVSNLSSQSSKRGYKIIGLKSQSISFSNLHEPFLYATIRKYMIMDLIINKNKLLYYNQSNWL